MLFSAIVIFLLSYMNHQEFQLFICRYDLLMHISSKDKADYRYILYNQKEV